jgi:drug/metabolite transporter (DMT)-like permease
VNWTAVLCAFVSAALFGISTPAAKALVGSVHPAVLAGLLYCGAGIGITAIRRALPRIASRAPEVPLTRSDLPGLAGAIGSGGVLGPLLLMSGLTRTDAATASLLLTLEASATALMAWFIFHENYDRRIALGMACLIAGAGILSWSGAPTVDNMLGPLAIVGACIAWGLDNNLTRKVSSAWGDHTPRFDCAHCRLSWFSRLRHQPCLVRACVTRPRNRSHQRILFYRAIH